VKSSELVTEPDGSQLQRETSQRGEVMVYALESVQPSQAITRRIATENLPYGGRWSFVFAPENGGTRVRITEDGEVYNPVFRFVSRFILGQTATLDAYLGAMGKATGQAVQIEN
jgi:hypothetical protein